MQKSNDKKQNSALKGLDFNLIPIKNIKISLLLGNTSNPASLAIVQGTIIVIFDLIENTFDKVEDKLTYSIVTTDQDNCIEAQVSFAVKINLLLIIILGLQILKTEVQK